MYGSVIGKIKYVTQSPSVIIAESKSEVKLSRNDC